MNQEKGITLISLMVTILIFAIVVGLAIRTASPFLEKATVEDLTTELMLIQAKWKVEIQKVNFDGTSNLDETIINTTEGENKGKLQDQFKYSTNGEEWMDSSVKAYYQLPDKALEDMGIQLEKNPGYLVNYENDEVIYLEGFEAEDGKIYYKLSEIKEL